MFYNWIAELSQAHAYKLPLELSRESLVEMLAQFVFVVTGWHEYVGSVVEFL